MWYSQEGPSHAPHFEAEVTIDGQTFKSPKQNIYFRAQDAEAAAAALAMESLPPVPVQQPMVSPFVSFLFPFMEH